MPVEIPQDPAWFGVLNEPDLEFRSPNGMFWLKIKYKDNFWCFEKSNPFPSTLWDHFCQIARNKHVALVCLKDYAEETARLLTPTTGEWVSFHVLDHAHNRPYEISIRLKGKVELKK